LAARSNSRVAFSASASFFRARSVSATFCSAAHAAADLEPPGTPSGAQEQASQGHAENLVRDAIDVPQWLQDGVTQPGEAVRGDRVVGLGQPLIEPADQVAVGNVPDEQEQAVGDLVEVAVSQPMGWHRAGADVIRLGAGAARLLVSAVIEMPIGFQLRASWSPRQILPDRGPGRATMPVHVIFSDLVRNPLKAEAVN